MLSISRLRSFSDERFYSLLDVCSDIRDELDFNAHDIVIPLMRHLVMFPILLPASTPSMMDRYCDLRWKALKFLESETYVTAAEYLNRHGLVRWEDAVRIKLSKKTEFYELVVLLTEEQERREPTNAANHDFPSAMSRIEQLCNRFHAAALKLKTRHGDRAILEIKDEYDVQYLLGGLLESRFFDVRSEEWTQSRAGKPARMDFLLKDEAVVVEAKMTRDGLTDGKLGDELILDIDRYKTHEGCKALFCFVYDPDHRLKNPSGLETDLSRKTDGLLVRVRIRPTR